MSPVTIQTYTVYDCTHAPSWDRGPVGGKPGRRASRKDHASSTLWPGGGTHFVFFKMRSIMGIHLGTLIRKS